MNTKPITQRAKNSPFKSISESLITGAAQTARQFVDVMGAMDGPGKKPKMKKTKKGKDEEVTTDVEGYSGKPSKLSAEQAAWRDREIKRLGGVQAYRDYYKIGEKTKVGERKEIIKGKDVTEEQPYMTYDYGDVLTSPQQRKVNRGMLKDVRMAGKMARKLARFEGKTGKERRRAAKDAKKVAMEKAIAAQKAFAQTQRDAAEQGIAPGSRGRSKVQMSGKMEKYGREMGYPDFSTDKQEELFMEGASGINMNAKTPFKMKGYGNKTYKK